MIKKLITVCLLLAVSSTATAGVVSNLTITRMDMGWDGEGVYVDTVGNTNTYGCEQPRFGMASNNPLFDQNLTVLLSAFHAGSKVEFYFDGCFGGVINLKAVAIY